MPHQCTFGCYTSFGAGLLSSEYLHHETDPPFPVCTTGMLICSFPSSNSRTGDTYTKPEYPDSKLRSDQPSSSVLAQLL